MPDISTVLILIHPKDALDLHCRVMIHHDLDSLVPADVCFVHVDLSVGPPRYTKFASQYPNTINLHITDIRKKSCSRNQIMRG